MRRARFDTQKTRVSGQNCSYRCRKDIKKSLQGVVVVMVMCGVNVDASGRWLVVQFVVTKEVAGKVGLPDYIIRSMQNRNV